MAGSEHDINTHRNAPINRGEFYLILGERNFLNLKLVLYVHKDYEC